MHVTTDEGASMKSSPEQGSVIEEGDIVVNEIQDRAAINGEREKYPITGWRTRKTDITWVKQLLNSTLMSTTKNDKLVDNIQSIGNMHATTYFHIVGLILLIMMQIV